MLEGLQVVLTRSVDGNQSWATYFTELGAKTYGLPTIDTLPAELTKALQYALEHLEQFRWIVFTSAAGVRYAQAALKDLGIDVSAQLPAVAVVGEQTAAAARTAGMRVAFRPSRADGAALAAELTPVDTHHVLLLRTSIASDELVKALEQRGATVTSLPVYVTKPRTDRDAGFSALLHAGETLYLTFASPSAVKGFTQRVTADELTVARQLPAVAVGPSVAAVLRGARFEHIYTATEPSVEAVAEVIRELSQG